jgi:hypothetical protein
VRAIAFMKFQGMGFGGGKIGAGYSLIVFDGDDASGAPPQLVNASVGGLVDPGDTAAELNKQVVANAVAMCADNGISIKPRDIYFDAIDQG